MKVIKKSLVIISALLTLSICTSYGAETGAEVASWLDDAIAKAGASIANIEPILTKLHTDFFKADKTTVRDDLFEADKVHVTQATEDNVNDLVELIENADI